MTESNTGVYVDCGSLWHGAFGYARANGSSSRRVDYQKLMEKLLTEGKPSVIRAYIVADAAADVLGFQNSLAKMGYETVLVRAKTARDIIAGDISKEVANWGRLVLASDDPMLGPTVNFASSSNGRPALWYSFMLRQEGPHWWRFLDVEVMS